MSEPRTPSPAPEDAPSPAPEVDLLAFDEPSRSVLGHLLPEVLENEPPPPPDLMAFSPEEPRPPAPDLIELDEPPSG